MDKNNRNGILKYIQAVTISSLVLCALLIGLMPNQAFAQEKLRVVFMDVGQADSILIKTPTQKAILIDGGNREDGDQVLKKLQQEGVEKLDFLIATHPHEDHIGGLPQIVEKMEIGKIYMPKVASSTQIFEKLLKTIQQKGMSITSAKAGTYLLYDKDIKLQIIAPCGKAYDETNEYSVVLKLTYGNTSFLFTGDAEGVSEKEMLSAGSDLKSDVLKVGHHGGRTSTSQAFLNQVHPKFAVISVGKDNDYGHPHQELLDRLKGTEVLRTDVIGSIVMVSDGKKIEVLSKTEAGKQIGKIFITKSGKKYHRAGCSGLSHSQIPITLKEAQAKGYGPCQICHP